MGERMLLEPLRRIPAARTVARALRRGWEELRPLPRARYIANTPNTGGAHVLDAFFPPTISTIAEGALSFETRDFIIDLLHKLTPNDQTEGQELFYQWGRRKFGQHWRYADITTALCSAAMAVRPKTYLEIGIRRGRSAAVVGALCPDCAIYGFDLWLPGYAAEPNPGPDFVRGELRTAGHTGDVTLISGDSKKTVPAFLREHPGLFFDVITVDGDHSVSGAARDLANVLPRLKVGGVIVFDDICSAPALARVWRWFVQEDDRYRSWEFTDADAGIAAAIRTENLSILSWFSKASRAT
jgi:predicted O-methyltransferase YrrM